MYLLMFRIQCFRVHTRPPTVVGLDRAPLLLFQRAFECLSDLYRYSQPPEFPINLNGSASLTHKIKRPIDVLSLNVMA